MSSTNVGFYEKLKDLQDRQHDSEQKRLVLEHQMNVCVKSDHRLAKLKAIRLQNYWKKICEDEKRSQWRNEQLLKDFERVESHMATLGEKSERLRIMKRQYEDYVERTYPNWKEKVMQYQRFRQMAEKERQQKEQEALAREAAARHSQLGGYLSLPDMQEKYRISHTLPNMSPDMGHQPAVGGYSMADSAPHLSQSLRQQQGLDVDYDRAHDLRPQYHEEQAQPGYMNLPQQRQPQPNAGFQQDQLIHHGMTPQPVKPTQHLQPPSANSTLNTVSSLPTAADDNTNLRQQKEVAAPSKSPQQPVITIPSAGGAESHSPHRSNLYEESGDSGDEGDDELMSPRKPPTPRETLHKESKAAHTRESIVEEHDVSEAVSDFGDDDELPLSDKTEPEPSRPSPTPRSARGSVAEAKTPEPESHHSMAYPIPDVTLDGLFNLLGAVENEFPSAFSPEEYYRTRPPAISVKKEILNNADKGAILSHVEGTSISMVILEQLELLVLNSEAGCMLPDEILFRPAASPTEESISEHIHPTMEGFWEKLYDHFKMLLKHEIMEATSVGEVFGPKLISADSPYEDKAKILITNLMENVSQEELMRSPQSSDTFSTIPSPRKRESLKRKEESLRRQQTEEEEYSRPTVPPLDLHSEEEEVEPPPTTLQLPAPATTTIPNLSQSAAYRQLLGDTMSTQKTMSYEVSDDSSDDIENQLGSVVSKKHQTQSSPPEGPLSPRQEPVHIPTEPPVSPAEDSKLSTDTLGDTGGYVPSALGDTGKSGKSVTGSLSLGSSGKVAKKPAFRYGDSDTDEDIDLPGTGTTSQHEDKGHEADDCFDFYG